MKATKIELKFVLLLSSLAFVWANTVAEEKPEARLLDENAYRNLVQNPLALSLGLLTAKNEKNPERETVIISSTANNDKFQNFKPTLSVEKLASLNLPNSFLPSYPQLPTVFGLPTTASTANAPIYTHRHEHYYNSPTSVNNEWNNFRLNTLMTLLRTLTYSPYPGIERLPYLNGGRSPSFIIINPAHFGPYIQSQYNREVLPTVATSGYGRNSGITIAAERNDGETPNENTDHDTLVDMKPIFMTGPELADETEANFWNRARINPSGNALLDLILAQNRRKQLHDDMPAAYLRSYKSAAVDSNNNSNDNNKK